MCRVSTHVRTVLFGLILFAVVSWLMWMVYNGSDGSAETWTVNPYPYKVSVPVTVQSNAASVGSERQQPYLTPLQDRPLFRSLKNPGEVLLPNLTGILPKLDFLPEYSSPCWYEKDNSLKCVPKVYLIGISKSGTTDLADKILQHPNIRGWGNKEVHFWDYSFLVDDNSFRGFVKKFARTSKSIQAGGHGTDLTFDATPSTMWFDRWKALKENKMFSEFTTPHFLKAFTPDVKFIVILRDPTERLYSHFAMEQRNLIDGVRDWNATYFHNDIKKSIAGFKECLRTHNKRFCVYDNISLSVKRRGNKTYFRGFRPSFYDVHIEEWFSVFPREQFFFTTLDEYKTLKGVLLNRIFDFLGLAPHSITFQEAPPLNNAKKDYQKHGGGELPAATRAMLDEFFTETVHKTATMLNDAKFLWRWGQKL